MRIAITGASGLVGSALTPHLESRGHEVIRLQRAGRPARAGSDAHTWSPERGLEDDRSHRREVQDLGDDDLAADDRRQQPSDRADNRVDREAYRVLKDNLPLRKPLGPRGGNVRFLEFIQEGSTQDADGTGCTRDGQDEQR